jgi:hypothetical protein
LPIREGTELLNAGWVTAIGIAPFPVENRMIGLVVQTSSISARPHEVKMDFLKKTYEYWKCVCSCKAGIGKNASILLLVFSTSIGRYRNVRFIKG